MLLIGMFTFMFSAVQAYLCHPLRGVLNPDADPDWTPGVPMQQSIKIGRRYVISIVRTWGRF